MNSLLPATGTASLLQALSPYIPDDFINSLRPAHRGRGRRRVFSPAQLWRTHLLTLLSPAHSFNLLVTLLPEQRAWRRFAHLPNRQRLPDAWMLHEFRHWAGVTGLRRINEYLLESLLPPADPNAWAVSLMDATDWVAADCGFKKKPRASTRPSAPPWARAH